MKHRKWTEKQLREAIKKSTSIRQVLIHIGLREAGGNYSQMKQYIERYRIDTKHFTGKGWSKGLKGTGQYRIPIEDILIQNSNFQSHKLKNRLFKAGIKKSSCEICGWAKKSSDGRIPVELDHINGNRKDNRIINLRILCPNCHSLQTNHRGRNIKGKKI